MAKHYYNVELVLDDTLDEDDVFELETGIENIVRQAGSSLIRITTEYVDSEDI